jgi:N-acetylglucosamine-6-phosphate deacetylase
MKKDLFLLMSEQEINTSNFLPTKKEITKSSKEFALKLIEDGNHNPEELFAQALRLSESLSIITDTLKRSLPEENFEAFGLKGTYRSGGDAINYKEDPIYCALKEDLDNRAELLKTAQKQAIIDASGNDVPKVSTTPRKSSLAISF